MSLKEQLDRLFINQEYIIAELEEIKVALLPLQEPIDNTLGVLYIKCKTPNNDIVFSAAGMLFIPRKGSRLSFIQVCPTLTSKDKDKVVNLIINSGLTIFSLTGMANEELDIIKKLEKNHYLYSRLYKVIENDIKEVGLQIIEEE